MGAIERALERAKRSRANELDDTASLSRRRKSIELRPETGDISAPRLAKICRNSVPVSEDVLLENRIVAAHAGEPGAADAYKMLRTKVLRRMVRDKARVLAVTSTRQGEGKTLTAINLAMSISKDPNFDAVLIDADLRSPSIHTYLGLQPAWELYDYLQGRASLEDVLVSPQVEGLGVVPNTHALENSSEALMSARMHELIDELRALSPAVVVVLDMPPLIIDDVFAFAPLIDSVLLTFKIGVTSREDVIAAREVTSELPVLGCVLNGVSDLPASSYYY